MDTYFPLLERMNKRIDILTVFAREREIGSVGWSTPSFLAFLLRIKRTHLLE